MNLKKFIENNGIRQADAIIVKREKLGLFDHFVIFLGFDGNSYEPIFIANFGNGVDILSTSKLMEYLRMYKPISINRFIGSESDREYAVSRALSDLSDKSNNAYHLIKNNCEHFANWVQKGVRESDQVKSFGNATAIGGFGVAAVGLASENRNMVWGGLIVAALGGIVSSLAENDD